FGHMLLSGIGGLGDPLPVDGLVLDAVSLDFFCLARLLVAETPPEDRPHRVVTPKPLDVDAAGSARSHLVESAGLRAARVGRCRRALRGRPNDSPSGG